MDHIDCIMKLALNITQCFPYFKLVTKTRLDSLIKPDTMLSIFYASDKN